MTRLIDVRPERAARTSYERAIAEAGAIVRRGGLVAFPTETVYGLAADALDEAAVGKVYEVKARPRDQALTMHLAGPEEALRYLAEAPPPRARRLMDRFWPGPLTLILRKSPAVPAIVTGGKDTVALRVPAHRVALDFISAAGSPVVGPSANRSSNLSPTSAADVLAELGDDIDAVLDAGPTPLGIDSTVLDLTVSPPEILRPGTVTAEDLLPYVGELAPSGTGGDAGDGLRSPASDAAGLGPTGARASCALVLVDLEPGAGAAAEVWRLAHRELASGRRPGVLVTEEGWQEGWTQGWAAGPPDGRAEGRAQVAAAGRARRRPGARDADGALEVAPNGIVGAILGPRDDPAQVAGRLYAGIRALLDRGCDVILAEPVERRGLGAAVMDRLYRAAGEVARK